MEYPTKEFPSYPPESGTSSCQLPTHFSSLPQHSALSFFPCQRPTILIFPRHSALRTQHFPSSLAHCQLPIAYCQLSSSSLGTQHSELSTFFLPLPIANCLLPTILIFPRHSALSTFFPLSTFLRLLFEHASLCWTHNCTINTTSPSSSFRGEKPGNPAGG